jgi:proton-dependent oligopeptide transporter, POT family
MSKDRDKAFFGHPAGLSTLFFTEMWERFSYYGMRAILGLYLAAPKSLGGQGFIDELTQQELPIAGAIVGMFGASVYLLGLPGGWIADRFIGQRKAVLIGGVGIALGNAILAIPSIGSLFYVGLVIIAIGTGFLKPNISALVGQLYREGDIRRDAGYTIYYMGINIGATLAPFACGFLAQHSKFRNFLTEQGWDPNLGWSFAFGCSAVGMVVGLVQYIAMSKSLGEAGKHPTIPEDPKRAARDRHVLAAIGAVAVALGITVVVGKPSSELIADAMGIGLIIGSVVLFYGLYRSARNDKERRGILAMIPLYLGAISFFAIFEQAPTTLNFYADNIVERQFLGIEIPASFYQSVNAIFIVALAPVFAWIWVWLGRRKKEPTSVNKFAIGMVLLSLAFVVMIPVSDASDSNKISGGWLIGLYFFFTIAELCISPVGLSSMSKLAPARLGGMVMGVWFLGTAIGIYLAGRATEISAGKGYSYLFTFLMIASLVVAAVLFIIAPMIKKMMGKDAHASGPADKSEKAEPEPLPTAKTHDD